MYSNCPRKGVTSGSQAHSLLARWSTVAASSPSGLATRRCESSMKATRAFLQMQSHTVRVCIAAMMDGIREFHYPSLTRWLLCAQKNIDALFQEARAMDAVLVFDEAESLFGSRSDNMSSSTDRCRPRISCVPRRLAGTLPSQIMHC